MYYHGPFISLPHLQTFAQASKKDKTLIFDGLANTESGTNKDFSVGEEETSSHRRRHSRWNSTLSESSNDGAATAVGSDDNNSETGGEVEVEVGGRRAQGVIWPVALFHERFHWRLIRKLHLRSSEGGGKVSIYLRKRISLYQFMKIPGTTLIFADALFSLPSTEDTNGPIAKLPARTTILPREKLDSQMGFNEVYLSLQERFQQVILRHSVFASSGMYPVAENFKLYWNV